MSSYRSYGLPLRVARVPRPAGVALFAAFGVLGSLATLLIALAGLWSVLQNGIVPSRQLGVCAIATGVSLAALWINWGLWELLGWAWWANMLLTLLSAAALGVALRYVPLAGGVLGTLLPSTSTLNPNTVALALIVGMLAYHLIVLAYLASARTVFKVGVKDERPIWERIHRN